MRYLCIRITSLMPDEIHVQDGLGQSMSYRDHFLSCACEYSFWCCHHQMYSCQCTITAEPFSFFFLFSFMRLTRRNQIQDMVMLHACKNHRVTDLILVYSITDIPANTQL